MSETPFSEKDSFVFVLVSQLVPFSSRSLGTLCRVNYYDEEQVGFVELQSRMNVFKLSVGSKVKRFEDPGY